MNKRGQAGIITTVLIILVALAAVAIIAIFILNQVRNSVDDAELKSKLSQVDISATSVQAGNNYIILKKNSDSTSLSIENVVVTINGKVVDSFVANILNWNVFETKQVTFNDSILRLNDKIEVFVILKNLSKPTPLLIVSSSVDKTSSTTLTIVCSSDSDCGSATSSSSCISVNNLTTTTTTPRCNNPGKISSTCTNTTVITSSIICPDGCSNNACISVDPLTKGLVAYYPFNGTFNDYSGQGRNGVNNNAMFTTGKISQAASFNGINSSINLGSWFNYQSFTISFWVKTGANQESYADIMDNAHAIYSPAVYNWVIQTGNPGNNTFTWGIVDGMVGGIYFTLPKDSWANVVITRNATSMNNSLYVNGIILGSLKGTSDINYQSQNLMLGLNSAWLNRPFNGSIDEFRVYNRTLNSSEIQQLYALA